MCDDEELRKCQLCMLDILTVTTKLCEKHNISYWLDAGTLLGAVRHKGFIPWDDDVDISMSYDDYLRFVEIAKKELTYPYFLQNEDTDPNYPYGITKVRRLDTEYVEQRESGDEDFVHGIYIDIFYHESYKSRWFMKWIKWGMDARDFRLKYKKGSTKRALANLYLTVVLGIPVKFTKVVQRICKRYPSLYRGKNKQNFSYGDCCPAVVAEESDYLPVKYVENVFEGQGFCIPNKPEKVLRQLYGDDYMELPPVEQRRTHAKYMKC